MPTVLFICTANRFRSPLAEAAFKKCLKEDGCQTGWDVESAGLWTEGKLSPFPTAIKAAKEMGLDTIRTHRAQQITSEMLAKYDLVIVMQASQKEAIQIEFPETTGKITLLSEIVEGFAYDIPDPFETVEESHQELAEEICGLVKRGYKRISDLAESRENKPCTQAFQ